MRKELALFLLLALILSSCGRSPQKDEVYALPTVTFASPNPDAPAQSVQTPQDYVEPPQDEIAQVVNALEYLPQLYSAITTQQNVGGGKMVSTTQVYGILKEESPDYVMTGFDESQPFYFTDYFVGGEGWFARDSEQESDDLTFIMPLELYQGLCFSGQDGPCEVIGVDERVQVDDFVFDDALLLAVDSVTYGVQVFVVYQRGVGETARYIQHNQNSFELLSLVTDVEILEEQQVRQLIEDTVF